jgi:hypothetical protein
MNPLWIELGDAVHDLPYGSSWAKIPTARYSASISEVRSSLTIGGWSPGWMKRSAGKRLLLVSSKIIMESQ